MRWGNPLVFGTHDAKTVEQLVNCLNVEEGSQGVLCADGHVGYSMPIGGVVAYRGLVSPSGVGYDIACGNMAVRTDIRTIDVLPKQYADWADEIARRISFGIGRNNDEKVDSPVIDDIAQADVPQQRALVQLAANQLGTVGSGNHYVDVFEGADGFVWVGVHFGSRGFGHKTATMFLNVAKGLPIDARASDGEMMSPPQVFSIDSESGQDYIGAMQLAGKYAYAGREAVVNRVVNILGAKITDSIHNHHNFAWLEEHDGEKFWVVRKGATPARPRQRGFVGGSMGDISVILEGVDSDVSRASFYSTVHGAGRLMSRNQAIKGKHVWRCPVGKVDGEHALWYGKCAEYAPPQQKPPKDMKCPVHQTQLVKTELTPPINFRDVQDAEKQFGVELRGAGADEAPPVYRKLQDVLDAHAGTINILNVLRPRIVVMAGKDVRDPYKD
jgi:tRNA-splicing ligase RtcB